MKPLVKKTYSLCEAVADIAYIAGYKKHYIGNSRQDVENFILWAQEFEEKHKGIEWGVNSKEDYIDAIWKFAEDKIKEARYTLNALAGN